MSSYQVMTKDGDVLLKHPTLSTTIFIRDGKMSFQDLKRGISISHDLSAVQEALTTFNNMDLPPFGVPESLSFCSSFKEVRDLEYLEGPLLSELVDEKYSLTYVEKWCSCSKDGKIHRTLVSRSSLGQIEDYLDQKITLWDLLIRGKEDYGLFLFDYKEGKTIQIRSVELQDLPLKYLPSQTTVHDLSLRPM